MQKQSSVLADYAKWRVSWQYFTAVNKGILLRRNWYEKTTETLDGTDFGVVHDHQPTVQHGMGRRTDERNSRFCRSQHGGSRR
jgi:hypothetical protein